MVNTDIAILSPTSITRPLWMHSNSIQRPKMPTYTSNLIFEDFMIEPCFEFPLTGLCSGDIAGFLTTTKDNLN